MIIDIHAHTSNKLLRGLFTADATIERLKKEALRHSISKIALMATCFPLRGQKTGVSTLDLLDRIDGDPLFVAFGTIDAENHLAEGAKELRRLVRQRAIQGIKLYPGYQDINLSDKSFFDIYNIAADFNIPIAIHGGELQYCCPKDELDRGNLRCGRSECVLEKRQHLSNPFAFEDAFRAYPKVKFIVAHMANPYFDCLHELMQRYDNVFTDISGQFLSGTDEDTPGYRAFIVEKIKQFLDLPNGINRVMFGTDFPIQSYEDSISLVEALNLLPDEEAKIFYQNAQSVLDQNMEV